MDYTIQEKIDALTEKLARLDEERRETKRQIDDLKWEKVLIETE
jgi:cell division protein FtsB